MGSRPCCSRAGRGRGPAAAQAIARAVSELGAVDFAVRERAARFLWEQGRAAEPVLERAANSADVEVRLQAHRILEDFRYGILPDVPVDMQTLIREFRDGDVRQRQFVLQKLAIRQRFDTLQRLLQREGDPDVRRQLLVQLLETPQAIEKFIAGTALESLIGLVGADQDAAWRQATLAQILFTPVVLRRLAEAGRLEELTKLIDGEKDPGRRRELLAALFRNDEAVATLLDADQRYSFLDRMQPVYPSSCSKGSFPRCWNWPGWSGQTGAGGCWPA